jgi:hypothetical protein
MAIAQVKSGPIAINSNSDLLNELKKHNVSDFKNISYYNVEFHELDKNERFNYKLQQGIVKVHKTHIKRNASQRWIDISNASSKNKRIMRLSWNTNNWEIPSGHSWKVSNQGKSQIAYENQYGYGHEEWLFNERFRIDGYQYGYIRGVNNLSADIEKIDQVSLYTIRDDKQRCLVGNLFDVEIIEGYEVEQKKIERLISLYRASMVEELKNVNADYDYFKTDHLLPNVKFKWDEANILNQPLPVDFLDGAEFNRFQAYYLKEDLEEATLNEFKKESKFHF